jgi:hypothetical protein
MEAVYSCETSVILYRTTQRYIPEVGNTAFALHLLLAGYLRDVFLYPEDRDGMFLRNVGEFLPKYLTLHLRGQYA